MPPLPFSVRIDWCTALISISHLSLSTSLRNFFLCYFLFICYLFILGWNKNSVNPKKKDTILCLHSKIPHLVNTISLLKFAIHCQTTEFLFCFYVLFIKHKPINANFKNEVKVSPEGSILKICRNHFIDLESTKPRM